MDKKNYFNFRAFRKALYDGSLSETARLVYIHLLQKSSAKGCTSEWGNVEITKGFIASDLGLKTKKGNLAIKTVQRAIRELVDRNYIKSEQKYKGEGCPLTITLNFTQQFLTPKPFVNVHHYNPSLSNNNLANLANKSLSEAKLTDKEKNREVMDRIFIDDQELEVVCSKTSEEK